MYDQKYEHSGQLLDLEGLQPRRSDNKQKNKCYMELQFSKKELLGS